MWCTVPVLPLGKLGGRLGRRAKRGAKNDQRVVQKMTKEGFKTNQEIPKRGAKLIKTDQRRLQIWLIKTLLQKKR